MMFSSRTSRANVGLVGACAIAFAAAASSPTVARGAEVPGELIAAVRPAVVRIEVERLGGAPPRSVSSGAPADAAAAGKLPPASGFLIDRNGLVVTSYQAIREATRGQVVFADGRAFRIAGFHAIAPERDLALLHINGSGDLPALQSAKALPMTGAAVFAFAGGAVAAFPTPNASASSPRAPSGGSGTFGEEWSNMALPGKVGRIRTGAELLSAATATTSAARSNTAREGSSESSAPGVATSNLLAADSRWIETNCASPPLLSGGPLVNDEGMVVGMCSLLPDDLAGHAPPLNGRLAGSPTSYAVAVSEIAALVRSANLQQPPTSLSRLPRTTVIAKSSATRSPATGGANANAGSHTGEAPDTQRTAVSSAGGSAAGAASASRASTSGAASATTRSSSAARPRPGSAASRQWQVVLPSGETIAGPSIVPLAGELLQKKKELLAIAKKQGAAVQLDPTGHGAAEHDHGRPNGTLILFSDDRTPSFHAVYDHGKLDGPLDWFAPTGEIVYHGEYKLDKRHGTICYFEHNEPRIIAIYEFDRAKAVHLVRDFAVEKSFASLGAAKADAEAGPVLNDMERVEKDVAAREKEQEEVVRVADQDARHAKANALAPERRKDMIDRVNERRQGDQDIINGLRRAGGIGGR